VPHVCDIVLQIFPFIYKVVHKKLAITKLSKNSYYVVLKPAIEMTEVRFLCQIEVHVSIKHYNIVRWY